MTKQTVYLNIISPISKRLSLSRASQTTYWLAKENVASSKYRSVLESTSKAAYLLEQMRHASYQSRMAIEEFQLNLK